MPSGICTASQVDAEAGSSRSAIESRTAGTDVAATTAVAAAAPAASPSRKPAHSRGGRRPSGGLVSQDQQPGKTGLHRQPAPGGYPGTDKAPADQRGGQPKRLHATKVTVRIIIGLRLRFQCGTDTLGVGCCPAVRRSHCDPAVQDVVAVVVAMPAGHALGVGQVGTDLPKGDYRIPVHQRGAVLAAWLDEPLGLAEQ